MEYKVSFLSVVVVIFVLYDDFFFCEGVCVVWSSREIEGRDYRGVKVGR